MQKEISFFSGEQKRYKNTKNSQNIMTMIALASLHSPGLRKLPSECFSSSNVIRNMMQVFLFVRVNSLVCVSCRWVRSQYHLFDPLQPFFKLKI